MPPLYGVYLWIKSNPAAQIGLGIVAGLVVLRGWLFVHDRKVREADRLRAEHRARKAAKKIIEDQQEKSNDRIEAADDARADIPDDIDSASLSDDTASILFDSRRDSG